MRDVGSPLGPFAGRRAGVATASAARRANGSRNASRPTARFDRWAPARDALWSLLDGHVGEGARVAIVGAGNGDDLPLGRLAGRAGEVVLLDLDRRAAAGARAREPRWARRRITVRACDVTAGAADRIVRAASRQVPSGTVVAPSEPLPGAPYDVVVGDLLYSQLLFPAMRDLGIAREPRRAALDTFGPGLTSSVVARLHASAPGGIVVHVHDVVCWDRAPQPVTIEEILAVETRDPRGADALIATCGGPAEADPGAVIDALGIPVLERRLWRWPFTDGVDYLVRATVAGGGHSEPRSRRADPPGRSGR